MPLVNFKKFQMIGRFLAYVYSHISPLAAGRIFLISKGDKLFPQLFKHYSLSTYTACFRLSACVKVEGEFSVSPPLFHLSFLCVFSVDICKEWELCELKSANISKPHPCLVATPPLHWDGGLASALRAILSSRNLMIHVLLYLNG